MLKINKKIWFNIHSWIGIKLSILFFMVCFSGTLATLSNEMDWLFIPAARAKPSEQRASVNLMAKNVQEAFPEGKLLGIFAGEAPYLCTTASVYQDGHVWSVFVNPHTGKVQGATALTFYRFFRDLHYFLFIPFQVGNYIVLFFAFPLLVSLITALYFYKKWYKKLFELKTGKGKLVFYRSLHRLVGVWSVPFVIVFSVTGIWYFLERSNTANIARIGNARIPKLEVPTDSLHVANIGTLFDYDRAVAASVEAIPTLQVNTIFLPTVASSPVYITGKSHVPLVRNRANKVFIHPQTYEVVKVQKAEKMGTIMYLNDIADPIHFGDWGGLTTKIIWFFGGLGISALILTGLWIAFKRKVAKRLQKKQRMGWWKYIHWLIFAAMLFFMYYFLANRYQVETRVFLVVATGLAVFVFSGWYLFSYRIRKAVAQIPTAESSNP